jgi:hypothetical protein
MSLLILLVILVLLFGGVGFYGGSRYGPWSWSPLGIIFVILLILALTGRL